jgi:hypothetical protein
MVPLDNVLKDFGVSSLNTAINCKGIFNFAKLVILYTKNLNEKMNKLLGALNIVNKHIDLPIINVSNNKENIQLDDNDILFVKSYFVDDFKLYDDIKNRPELFKYVI